MPLVNGSGSVDYVLHELYKKDEYDIRRYFI